MQRHATLGHISPSLFPCSLAFRAVVHSRFTTFRVIMSHFFSSAFRATSPVVGIQGNHHFLVAAFRAITASQFLHSEPSSRSQFDVQSHHHRFSVSAFRAIIVAFQFRHSELSSVFRSTFRVASSISTFKVIIIVFSSAFRAIIDFHIDIQSRILGLTFRVIIITSQFRRSEPSLSLFSSAFRAIIGFQIDI